MVLFAKMIPSNIESSMFAMLTGLMNLSNGFSAKMLGNFINMFVGVHEENLSDLWILYIVQSCCSLLPLIFIWLVPRKHEVYNIQQAIELIEKYDSAREDQNNTDHPYSNTIAAKKEERSRTSEDDPSEPFVPNCQAINDQTATSSDHRDQLKESGSAHNELSVD